MTRALASGIADMKRRLAGLPGLAKSEAHEALRRTGADVVAAARAGLAAGPHDPSGTLAASLSGTLDEGASRVSVASSAPYAGFLEYGTRRMGARPFLRPAIAATREGAFQHARDALARLSARLKDRP